MEGTRSASGQTYPAQSAGAKPIAKTLDLCSDGGGGTDRTDGGTGTDGCREGETQPTLVEIEESSVRAESIPSDEEATMARSAASPIDFVPRTSARPEPLRCGARRPRPA